MRIPGDIQKATNLDMDYERLGLQIKRFEPLKNLSESSLFKNFLPALHHASQLPFPPTFTLAHRDLFYRLKFRALSPPAVSSLVLNKYEEDKRDDP